MNTLSISLTVALACFTPVRAVAQADDQADARLREECQVAAQALTRGDSARLERALYSIAWCGPIGGEALAAVLLQHRLEEEPGGVLERVVDRARFLVQPTLFEAASEVALDPHAGTVARVQALRIVFTQLNPGSLDPYESFVEDNAVAGGTLTEVALEAGRLSDDAYEATESRVGKLLEETDLPLPVRNAATRLLRDLLVGRYCGPIPEMSTRDCMEAVRSRWPREPGVQIGGNCHAAERILADSLPSPRGAWALAQMFVCPPALAAPVLSSVLRAHARGGESPEAIVVAFNSAAFFWDTRVLETLLEVARDPSAATVARVQALALLSVYLNPRVVPSSGFRAGLGEDGTPDGPCLGRSAHRAVSRPVGTEPTPGFRERVISELRLLAGEPGPPVLRSAAICAASAGR